jgi:hypothetical protein
MAHVCEKTIELEQVYTEDNIDAILLKLNIEEDKKPIIKEKIFITTEQLKSYKSILRREKRKFIDNKCILGLKYQTIKRKVNFIQISVICVSTVITFIETIKQYVMVLNFFETIVPILLSTYIGLILAISRFYKFEDNKEAITKLDEKLAFIINRIKYKLRYIESHQSLKPTSNFLGYLENLELTLNDFQQDGLEEVITQAMQETDIMMNIKEKLFYETKLTRLKLDGIIIQKNLENLEAFKCSNAGIVEHSYLKDMKLSDYKSTLCFPINYIYDFLFLSSSYKIDDTAFFNKIEEIQNKNDNDMKKSDEYKVELESHSFNKNSSWKDIIKRVMRNNCMKSIF